MHTVIIAPALNVSKCAAAKCLHDLAGSLISREVLPTCYCLSCWVSVGAVGVITVLVSVWIYLRARQRPHHLEAVQLNAFRAAAAAAHIVGDSAADSNTDGNQPARGAAAGAALRRSPAAGTACPICLNDITMPAQANCGHWYCGTCIIDYWRHSSRTGGQLRCPCCRRGISLLYSGLTQDERDSEEGSRLSDSIGQYNRRHSGLPISFIDRIRDTPTLLGWLLAELFSPRGTALLLALHFTLPAVGSVASVAVYVLSPIDLVPDWSVIGLLDDVVVFLLLLVFISSLYRTRQAAGAPGSAHYD